jgi:hypothetical protein
MDFQRDDAADEPGNERRRVPNQEDQNTSCIHLIPPKGTAHGDSHC